MNKITVLLTGVGAPGAPGIIKCLRKNGEREIRIIGVDMSKDAGGKSMADIFYNVPPASDNNFISVIKEICLKESVDIILPIVTRELMKFSCAKPDFYELGIKIAVMDEKTLRIANDKGKLLSSLMKSNIPTPNFLIAKTVEEIKAAFFKLGYPEKAVCIKPTLGNGSRGVRVIDPTISKFDLFFNSKPNSMYISYEELISTLSEKENIPEILIMQYLPGDEYSVDILARNGEIRQIVGRHNFIVSSSIPLGCTLEYREDAINQSIEICRYLTLDGNIGIDFKYNEQGEPRIMEINPRLTATIVAPAAAGINFPYLGIKQLLDEPIDTIDAKYDGIKMIRRWEEIFEDSSGNFINW